MRDYTEKAVYVGIDVHKKHYVLAAICEDELVKKDKIAADPEGLTSYLNKYYAGAKISTVYEAGFSGYHLHRYLEENGIKNYVVHPASIEISSRDRVKTDKRDAIKMAVQLAAGRLKSIDIPPVEQENKRLLNRVRERLVNDRKKISCRIKCKRNLNPI